MIWKNLENTNSGYSQRQPTQMAMVIAPARPHWLIAAPRGACGEMQRQPAQSQSRPPKVRFAGVAHAPVACDTTAPIPTRLVAVPFMFLSLSRVPP